MAIDEITREIITNASAVGLAAMTAGLMLYGGIKMYRNTKSMNRMFDSAIVKYKDDFSKEDLLAFYEDMEINFRKNFLGKRRRIAEDICDKLENQVMRYAAQEMIEYIAKGNTLDFGNPLEVASPTYKVAKATYDKSHSPSN